TQSDAAPVSVHAKVPLADQDIPSARADERVSAGLFDARDAALADANVRVALADSQPQVVAEPGYTLASVAPDARVPPLPPLEPLDNCPASETCIDQYLWQLYERARKVDTI